MTGAATCVRAAGRTDAGVHAAAQVAHFDTEATIPLHGFQRGRTIGFPTANLKPQNRVVPKFGVYATGTLIDNEWRRSITNVGVRPTFENETIPSVETFVFDFDGDLYGDSLRLRFLYRIRDERKFNGIDELKSQIKKDCDVALEYFSHEGVRNMLKIV